MTAPQHAVIARLSANFATMSQQFAAISADLTELDRVLTERPSVPQNPARPVPTPMPAPQPYPPPAAVYPPPQWPVPPPAAASPTTPAPSPPPKPPRDTGWIGKVLAVAGVAVTLIGVVLMLVLAAQAGILRPQIRVAAGGLLAATLVGVATRLNARPGGRVGAIALAATGVAAAYMDVIAVTTIYHWVPPWSGLVIAAVIGGGGLTLARSWDSQHLGLLVLVPLIVLAPFVADGVTMLLIAFMLAIAAASLLAQLGRDWPWLHAARVAAPTFPLLIALVAARIGDGNDAWLAGGCAIAAVLAISGTLVLLPSAGNRATMASLAAVGTLPVLCASTALPAPIAALMAVGLAAALVAIVVVGDRLPGVTASVRHVWSATAAVSALIAVTVAFEGEIAAPVLLAMALVISVAGRRDTAARLVAAGFGVIGGLLYVGYAPPTLLVHATPLARPDAVAVLIASVLLIAAIVITVWSWTGRRVLDTDAVRVLLAAFGVVIVYAVSIFTVTAGVLVGGESGGFFAGHMAATICWIAMAAALFSYAARRPREDRSVPIAGGLALVAGSMAKLFLFDLGTLDGVFRVVVFIVVGVALLGMGAAYARVLAQQDQHDL